MRKARMGAKLLAGSLLFWSGVAPAWGAPTVAQILGFKPRQEGISYSIPSAQEQEGCKVELVNGSKNGSNGWVLKDAKGQPLRRFFDTNGDRKIDVFSYYQDGVEVYREIDSNYNEKVDQYRWLNANGMKWGIDANEDGKIDGWKIISAEEASQEILTALATKDFDRLEALWLTESELKAMDLPTGEVTRLRKLQKEAQAKFQGTCTKLALTDKAKYERFEANAAQCIPAEQAGTKHDLIKQQKGTILYEHAGTHNFVQTGEMIQVGLAWRLVDAPTPGTGDVPSVDATGGGVALTPEIKELLEELKQVDDRAPKGSEKAGPRPEVVEYNLKRADILLRIVAKVKADDREQWYRQVADCFSAASQNGPETDKAAYAKLVQLEKQIERESSGSALAAYVTYREMSAEYAAKLAGAIGGSAFTKLQNEWVDRLSKFVQTYPKADDTPDAMIQLGMVSEFLNKETEAKNWYGQLVKNFANHTLAAKAEGAIRRLTCEGKPFELTGQKINGGSFNITELAGKAVVVYYWASWNQQCSGDFQVLKKLNDKYAAKGLELVCVNLDNSPPETNDIVRTNPNTGTHLYHAGGLESPLATQYGIMVLPHLFLVDKDGKVLSPTIQVNNLEDELKKLLK